MRCNAQSRSKRRPAHELAVAEKFVMTPGIRTPTCRHLVDGIDGVKRYRKRIIEVDVRFAEQSGSVTTLEGEVACAPGDALVTGTKDEIWPVTHAAFKQKYDAVPPTVMGKPGHYRTRATLVLAVQLTGPLHLALPSGKGILSGDKGDWIVQYAPRDQGIVNSAIFEETYEVAD